MNWKKENVNEKNKIEIILKIHFIINANSFIAMENYYNSNLNDNLTKLNKNYILK